MKLVRSMYLGQSSYENFPWFHPDEADDVIEIGGSSLLVFNLRCGAKLGFEQIQGTDVYGFDNYYVYKLKPENS